MMKRYRINDAHMLSANNSIFRVFSPSSWGKVRGKAIGLLPKKMKSYRKIFILSSVLILLTPGHLWAQLDLQYQVREDHSSGDRWKEGVKPKPVSGFDIELISVLADYQEPISDELFPKQIKIRFYLDKEQSVSLTVRELDYRTYYWLNQKQLKKTWSAGFQNEFVWPTGPVLKELRPPVQLYDLGALVRLQTETTSSVQLIAPAVLYHSNPPAQIQGYVFTLKTGEDVRLEAKIIKKETGEIIDKQLFRRKRAGRPFSIRWKAEEESSGAYLLAIKGFSLSTNQAISQKIHFYHQRSLIP